MEGPREADEASEAKLRCSASHFDYANVTWYKHDPNRGDLEMLGGRGPREEGEDGLGKFKVTLTSTAWSLSKELR